MLSTPLSFQLITRDMSATLKRTAALPEVNRATEYYRENIGKVTSLDDFLDDHQLYSYAMKAFGLEDMTYAKAFMRKVLESDLTDKTSFANKMVDTRYQEFAKAFSFLTPTAQSAADKTKTEDLYAEKAAEAGASTALISLETMAFEASMAKVTTVDEFLANDNLVDYIKTAFGVNPKGSDASVQKFLRQVLTSDPADADSFAARQSNPAWLEMASAFNFSSDGNVMAQTSEWQDQTVQNYLRQTVETNAGKENEGVRLALYFERKAASIDSAYDLLADKAMLQVVQTTLGLSEQTGQADIDVQASYIADRLDIKSLSDPDELKQFLTRFTALWEVANPTTSATSTMASLITGQSSSVMSADMLMSLQGLKLGGL